MWLSASAALLKIARCLCSSVMTKSFLMSSRRLHRTNRSLLALYFLWEGALFTFAWRLIYVWTFTSVGLARRAVVVGTGSAAHRILEIIREQGALDIEMIGFVATGREAPPAFLPAPLLGAERELSQIAEKERIAEIVLAVQEVEGSLLEQLLACQQAGLDVVPMATVYEQVLRRLPVAYLEPDWLFRSFAEAVRAKDASRLAKRLVDVAGGAIGTVVFLAALPVIAPLIWLGSGRPIFYRQARVGRAGRPFRLVKFRTMARDAERDGAQWARGADPRVTGVGRILRRARLDELPNFLSVLTGEMSLVGPRPERPEFVAELDRAIPFYRARLLTAPGLTGWAQINYPYGDSVEAAAVKLEYDLYYLKHRSLLFDLTIIARTIATVLRFEGR